MIVVDVCRLDRDSVLGATLSLQTCSRRPLTASNDPETPRIPTNAETSVVVALVLSTSDHFPDA